jgi:hypothetical protein
VTDPPATESKKKRIFMSLNEDRGHDGSVISRRRGMVDGYPTDEALTYSRDSQYPWTASPSYRVIALFFRSWWIAFTLFWWTIIPMANAKTALFFDSKKGEEHGH